MRILHLLLILICFLAVFHLPNTAVSERRPRRNWRGWFLFSKAKCLNRCRRKHGYFKDQYGAPNDATEAKIYLLKCQCTVSKGLKQLIVNTFGPKVARNYSFMNFRGKSDAARAYLLDAANQMNVEPLEFMSQAELEAFVRREQRGGSGQSQAEEEKQLALLANRQESLLRQLSAQEKQQG